MSGDPRVLDLIEEILDSGRTPEEVCRACPELLPEVRERWGQLNILVNATGPGGLGGIEQLTDDEWSATIDLGAMGMIRCVRAAIPLLNVGYDPDTYSAGLIEFVSAFVSRRGEITVGEITAWATDLTSLGPAYFFSLNRYLFVGVRG